MLAQAGASRSYGDREPMRWTHDLIVIGAGAAGLTAAGGCARLGLRVALVERDRMGGECLNTGCVPSKALIAAAKRAHGMRGAAMGIASAGPAVNFAGVRAHVQAAIAAIAAHDSAERFAAWGVEVIRGEARLTGRREVAVDGRRLTAPRIVMATGSRPAVPGIPGLADVPYLTNETLFGLQELPRHLLVLGAGAMGVEMAQAFRRLGSDVTLLDAGQPLAGSDPEAVALVLRSLAAEGVMVRAGATVARVAPAPGGLRLDLVDGGTVEGSHLLLAAGRKAALDGLGLEAAGISASDAGIVVDRRRRTANSAVFAIGDCRDGPRMTHAAGYEGTVVVMNIAFGWPGRVDYRTLPAVIYTDPELAQLGLTEAEARAKHQVIEVQRTGFGENDRAIADGAAVGFAKVLLTRGKVVGVTMVGMGAGELLLPWSLAMRGKASPWAIGGAIVAYPTRSDISKALGFMVHESKVFGPAARALALSLATLRRL